MRANAQRRREKRNRRNKALRAQIPEIRNCESPIEVRLLVAIKKALPMGATMRVQVPIGPYRADILVESGPLRIVVEADGKEWHTEPEDVAHDRRRDAYMKAHGFKVARFAGSEINRNAATCAVAVVGIVRGSMETRVRKQAARTRAQAVKRQANDDARRERVAVYLRQQAPIAKGK